MLILALMVILILMLMWDMWDIGAAVDLDIVCFSRCIECARALHHHRVLLRSRLRIILVMLFPYVCWPARF